METKCCRTCEGSKPISEFGRLASRPDGLNIYCKQCARDRSRKWRRLNAEKKSASNAAYRAANPDYMRDYRAEHADRIAKVADAWWAQRGESKSEYLRLHSIKRHGISPDEFFEQLASQDGRCGICRADQTAESGRRLAIDHDHEHCPGRSGCRECIRGIICARCNTSEDRRPDPEAWHEYVRRPRPFATSEAA